MPRSIHVLLLASNALLSSIASGFLLPVMGGGHALVCGLVLWVDGLLIHAALSVWYAMRHPRFSEVRTHR